MDEKHKLLRFLVTFFTVFVLLYYFFEAWIGITSEGKYYWKFAQEYLDFIKWYRQSILYVAKHINGLLGYNTIVEDSMNLRLVGGYKVKMVYSCLGLGINSVWIAFVMAYPNNKKIKWMLSGICLIWLCNSIRIALLLIQTNISGINNTAHHDVYNYIIYSLIIILMWLYTKSTAKQYAR